MHLIYQLNRRLKHIRRSFSSALRGQIAVLGLLFLLLMALHVLAMMLFEGLSLGDASWLTITTATTVGYGDISATTLLGRLSTAILMYLGGIFILAQLAGLVFEATAEKREQRLYGKLPIKTRNHIVIFGWRESYLTEAVNQIRNSLAPLHDADIVIVSNEMDTLPNHLVQQQVRHVVGATYDTNTFEKAAIQHAAVVSLCPMSEEAGSDFITLDLIARLNHYGTKATMVVELHDIKHAAHARDLGVRHIEPFNLNYPDMLARSILSPGAEVIVEEIMKDTKTEMLVLHLPIQATVEKVRKATHSTATLLGLQNTDGAYALHPDESTPIKDHPLIFLIDTDRYGNTTLARQVLEQQLHPLTDTRTIKGFHLPKKVGVIGTPNRLTATYLSCLQKELHEETAVYRVGDDCWPPSLTTDTDLTVYDALVILADDPAHPLSDAKTFASIRLLRVQLGYTGRIITEAVLPDNQARFTTAGANDVIRPVTNNLEILARCVLTGAEEVLDNLFSSYGHELVRVEVNGTLSWDTMFNRLNRLGLPLGYEDQQGNVEVLPEHEEDCRFQAIFLLVHRETQRAWGALHSAVGQALSL